LSPELQGTSRADRHEPDGRLAAAGDGPRAAGSDRPLLMADIDGVISLFGAPSPAGAPSLDGSFHSIEGIPHFLSAAAAAHLLALERFFDLVWASGWEEKANEHLPRLLGLPRSLPFLRFSRPTAAPGGPVGPAVTQGHWKLEAIDTYAGGRPLAWVDDALSPDCHEWAAARPVPTLLVQTVPERGLTAHEAQQLEDWARALQAA